MRISALHMAALGVLIVQCARESDKVNVLNDSLSVPVDTSGVRGQAEAGSQGPGIWKRSHEGSGEDLADRYSRTDDGTNELIDSYGSVIKKYSKQYGLDWRLIFALMKQESMFGEGVESERGAFGLMQLMPRTGEALASRLGLEEVFSPRNNIAAGIYYLWEQYDVFGGAEEDDRIRLTLASYNCGLGHILDAQEIVKYLKENPNSWQSVSMALPLLSKQFYTLHRLVWGMDKPGNGYFEGSKQTTNYVKSVIEYYEQFKVLLH